MSASTEKDHDMKIYKIFATLAVTLQITFGVVARPAEIDQLEQAVRIFNIAETLLIKMDAAGNSYAGCYFHISINSMAWWLLHKKYESSSVQSIANIKKLKR